MLGICPSLWRPEAFGVQRTAAPRVIHITRYEFKPIQHLSRLEVLDSYLTGDRIDMNKTKS